MINNPNTQEGWMVLVRRVGWGIFSFKISWMLIGVALTISGQLFTGFWDFRAKNQDFLRQQRSELLSAQNNFESHLVKIDNAFLGQPLQTAGSEYIDVAGSYIRTMRAISQSLPETSAKLVDCINAIAAFRKYYVAIDLPAEGTDEWMTVYSGFRHEYDNYLTASNDYIDVLDAEINSYVRYIINF